MWQDEPLQRCQRVLPLRRQPLGRVTGHRASRRASVSLRKTTILHNIPNNCTGPGLNC
jgi:hypothetical protein